MSVSKIKGWCPGAYHPMQSGDGLVFRVRPVKSSITRLQAIGLGQLALRYGSGLIDLTNRANLQIRGVPQHNMQDMIDGLAQLDLLDPDPAQEQRRNILVSPFWQKGDNTDLLETRLRALLPSLPEMPAKIGYAVDTSDNVMLRQAPADFRFERAHEGLILRADGCDRGRNVTLETAMQALQELVGWFTENRGDRRRMATAAREIGVPPEWQQVRPAQPDPVPEPGAWENGNTPRYTLFGAPFGQIGAEKLIEFAQQDGIDILRMTPWRMLARSKWRCFGCLRICYGCAARRYAHKRVSRRARMPSVQRNHPRCRAEKSRSGPKTGSHIWMRQRLRTSQTCRCHAGWTRWRI